MEKLIEFLKRLLGYNKVRGNETQDKSIIKVKEIQGVIIDSFYPIYLQDKDYQQDRIYELNTNKNTSKGVLEDYFFDFLNSISIIPPQRNISIVTISGTYRPDMVIVSKEDKVFFAIEIDEPYTLKKNGFIPIHYKDKDFGREKAIVNSGWDIIRFCEEQIALSPEECVNYINSKMEKLGKVDLKRIKRWTKIEAEKMIFERYRNNYLPRKFTDKPLDFPSISSYRSYSIRCLNPVLTKTMKGKKVVLNIETITGRGKYQTSDMTTPQYCFLDYNEFWKKLKLSRYGELIEKYDLIKKHKKRILPLPNVKGIYIKGFGRNNFPYFNLSNQGKFEFYCTDEFIEYYDNWWNELKYKSA